MTHIAQTHRGRVWKFGAHVDTDAIIATRYLTSQDPEFLRAHCLESLDPRFATEATPGDILVGLDNFGCGSSREHAPLAIKAAGIHCVIAVSFAGIFFRNSINLGLPLLECPELAREVTAGEELDVDLSQGTVVRVCTGRVYRVPPYPPFMQQIIAAGGLTAYVRKELEARR
ncbi:MAG TPA: 3-isopropylmalate dehydratase small subunit [Bacillota bacterium]|nr:3-isopropylmalate dehydratase small subunit [Bacillota bacterium]